MVNETNSNSEVVVEESNSIENLSGRALIDFEVQVEEYLRHNPRFFEGREALLSEMLLSHPQTGQTVSLLERQLAILRSKSDLFETQVNEFIGHAMANTQIFEKIQAFSAALMRTQTDQEAIDCIYQQMQILFSVDETSLHSFDLPHKSLDGLKQLGLNQRWANALATTLKIDRPLCGAIEEAWRQGLFYQHDSIASVCVIPLGENSVWGVLALGSLDLKYSGTETLFLKFIGQMVTSKLSHLFVESV